MGSVMLSVGALLFAILLSAVYFLGQTKVTIETKLYRNLIINTVIWITTELLETIVISSSTSHILKVAILNIHWISIITLFYFLYLYCISFVNNKEYKTFKELFKEPRAIIISCLSTIAIIVTVILPFNELNKISFVPGQNATFAIRFCVLIVFLIGINTIKNARNTTSIKKVAILCILLTSLISVGLQFQNPEISFLGLGVVIQLMFLYFCVENPDLKSIEEIEILNKEIEASSKTKSDFLVNMSSEITTPMNKIVSACNDIKSKEDDIDTAKEEIKVISKAGNSLIDIVSNILNMSKLESNNEEIEIIEYSLRETILNIRSIISERANDKNIKFIVDVDPTTPTRVYGDPSKIYQIVMNLLLNAVKYTNVGKVKLKISSEQSGNDVKLRFKISDTGSGIKAEEKEKLFTKFGRLNNATANEIEGAGLGLVISKRYAEMMNGKIWFDSEYGAGSNFYFEVMQTVSNTQAIGELPELTDEAIKFRDCSKYKVLIVDDDSLSLKTMSRLLGTYKFNVETTNNGRDCIYKIKAGNKYDMIFIDHMMPEMDGIETARKIRLLEDYDLPPIIAITANITGDLTAVYIKNGFDGYLHKPITMNALNNLINKYFKD